jgi:hypothetical protein
VEWSFDGPFQNCVRWSRLPTKMAAKLKIEKGWMKLKKNLLFWHYWANLNQTLQNPVIYVKKHIITLIPFKFGHSLA